MASVITDALKITKGAERLLQMGGGRSIDTPTTYEEYAELLHHLDIKETKNSIEHKMITFSWVSHFYKTWLFHRKTYLVDTDFFLSLTNAKKLRIYPQILKYMPFSTFAVDISGSGVLDGYVLCNIYVNNKGIYCSFVAHQDGMEDKPFGIFLNSDDMLVDENGEKYFELNKKNERNTDIEYFRTPQKIMGLGEIFKSKILPRAVEFSRIMDVGSEDDIVSLQEVDEEYYDRLDKLNDDKKWEILKKGLIQFAYYLATPEPDIYETRETKKIVKRTLAKKDSLDEVEYTYHAGTRIGARIRIGENLANDIGETVEYKNGTPKSPHVRRAHWMNVWCGKKGNQHLESRYVEISYVNFEYGQIDEVINEVTDKVKAGWEGENLIRRTLEAIEKPYKTQAPIIVDGHRYRFDSSIKIGKQICYIEFDGQQHFQPVSIFGGQEGFIRTKEADNIKNKYCFDHNIPLLRISYKEKGLISTLVREFAKDPDSVRFTPSKEAEYYKERD